MKETEGPPIISDVLEFLVTLVDPTITVPWLKYCDISIVPPSHGSDLYGFSVTEACHPKLWPEAFAAIDPPAYTLHTSAPLFAVLCTASCV